MHLVLCGDLVDGIDSLDRLQRDSSLKFRRVFSSLFFIAPIFLVGYAPKPNLTAGPDFEVRL